MLIINTCSYKTKKDDTNCVFISMVYNHKNFCFSKNYFIYQKCNFENLIDVSVKVLSINMCVPFLWHSSITIIGLLLSKRIYVFIIYYIILIFVFSRIQYETNYAFIPNQIFNMQLPKIMRQFSFFSASFPSATIKYGPAVLIII